MSRVFLQHCGNLQLAWRALYAGYLLCRLLFAGDLLRRLLFAGYLLRERRGGYSRGLEAQGLESGLGARRGVMLEARPGRGFKVRLSVRVRVRVRVMLEARPG